MVARRIEPAKGPLNAAFRAVPSKSATHRALLAAALADGTSEIRGPLDGDDTRRTLQGVRSLGVRVEEAGTGWIVHGTAGQVLGGASIDLGASGTSARFLTAFAALGRRPSLLDGTQRLRERPMEELVGALSALGATVEATGAGSLPIRCGGSTVRGGAVALSGARSSQFASALLLAAPAFAQGLSLDVLPPRVSFPYVLLTVQILEAWGAAVERRGEGSFAIAPQRLRPRVFEVEGDHSSASYLLAAAAIVGGRIRIAGLSSASVQPDSRLLRDLASLGCRIAEDRDGVEVEGAGRLPPFAWNLADAPDLAPTAAVLALFAEGPCTLSGLHHLALKESNRLAVLRENLDRLGARAESGAGSLTIVAPPRGRLRGSPIAVAGDHRIAMAFAIAGLAIPGVVIEDASVVSKSYPGFWADFDRLVRTGSSSRG